MTRQHEHLPPAGYVQALPTIEHGDSIPDGLATVQLPTDRFPALIRAMNWIREDSGGPSWPPDDAPHVAARWEPFLDRMEAAVAALRDDQPAPEDPDTNKWAAAEAEAGKPFCHLNSELWTFTGGEDTAQKAVAARSPELTLASHFLNDFFEGWTLFDDGAGFDPTKELAE